MTDEEFNFRKPIEQKPGIDGYVAASETAIRARIEKKQGNKPSRAWILVSFLMLSLVALGTFTLFQLRENNRLIAQTKSAVAGVSEQTQPNIVSGDGFSLLLKDPTPEGFKLQRRTAGFEFIEGKIATITSFTASPTKAGQQLTTGIEIIASEYDNKLDETGFEQAVLQKLGSGFEISSRSVVIPKELSLTKIQDKNNNDDLSYYVTVTSENYYLIKVYKMASRYSEYSETTRFADTFLQNLYLN